MAVASPLVLSSSPQGWDSSSGLENWTFPRCRRPDNTWNKIRDVFRTAAPKAVSPEPSFSPRNRPDQHSCTKGSKQIPNFCVGSLMLQIPEGKLKFRGSDYSLFNSETEFQMEIRFSSDLLFADVELRALQWGAAVTGIYSSSNPTLGTHSQRPEQPCAVPCCVADLENIALRGVADAQVEHCPSGHLEAVLWKAKERSWKSQAHKTGASTTPQHIQPSWNGQWRAREVDVKSHTQAGETTHWCFLPLPGEARAKTRQFLNKATEMQNLPGQNQLF